jgi:hypothetical protein
VKREMKCRSVLAGRPLARPEDRKCLRDQGLGHVFLVPGGHIDPLVAELGTGAGPQPIVAAHEEGAGFMADGYARVSGFPRGPHQRRGAALVCPG